MKEVIAIVRMNMMNRTKQALTEVGINGLFAHEALGRGIGFINKEVVEGAEAGYEEAASLLGEKGKLYAKRMITFIVEDTTVETAVEAITRINQTGKPGDGKIFVLPVSDAVRVRTAETGEAALG